MAKSVQLDAIGFSENELRASICRDSFLDFFVEMWDEVIPEPLVLNWHVKYFCRELQKVCERVFKGQPKEYDLLTNMPPGSTKSMVVSVMLPAWIWTRMPTARLICASFDKSLVHDLSLKTRDVIESDKYMAYFPEVRLRDDMRSVGKFATVQGGVRYTATVSGQSPMGRHAHFLIVDDPIDPREAFSAEKLKIAKRFVNNIIASRKIHKEVTPTLMTMQRLAQEDPSGDWIDRRKNVKHICLPAEITDNVRPARLRKYYKDGLLDPVRLSRTALEEYKLEGEHYYSGQFLQDPIPEGGLMFDVSMFSISALPAGIKFTRIARYWDKAYTDGGGAYTVGTLMAVEIRQGKQHFWVLDVVRGQWDSSKRERIIRQTAEMDHDEYGDDVITYIEQEPAAGKESAAGTVRTLAGYRVKKDVRGGKSDGDKVRRADAMCAQVNAGNFTLVKAEWNRLYLQEFERFPHSVLKDQVDSSSGAFNKIARRRRRAGALRPSAA
jgi:predicted phage terminase large subunit-like protein